MTKFRESLLYRMTRIYGFEKPIVINFCRMCETLKNNDWNDKCLTAVVESHEANPLFLED